MKLPLLVGFVQVCFSSNQTVGFFDHKYLRKESIGILDFLHGKSYQSKVASETTILVGFGQVGLSSDQAAGFFDQ